MSRHASPHRTGRGRWALAGLAALSGLAVTTTGVFAGLNAAATGTSAVSSGTLLLTLAADGGSGGLPMTVSNMAPGDVANVYVTLTNTGTLSSAAGMTLSDTPAAATLLTSDASRGLTVTITACPTAWSAGSCSGTPTTILAATPVATIGSGGVALSNVPALAAGGGQLAHLQFSLALPDTTETSTNGVLPTSTVQGLTSTITWTFTEQQRAATVTNA